MGFGGAVSSMITSLKNNARGKRNTYFDRDNRVSKEKIEINKLLEKKATPEQLHKIRKEIAESNKKNQIKNVKIIIITVVLLLLIYFVSQKIIFSAQ